MVLVANCQTQPHRAAELPTTKTPNSRCRLERLVMLTDFQRRCVDAIKHLKSAGYDTSNDTIAWTLGNNKLRLAVNSAMRSLEKQGLAGYTRFGGDQWSVQEWYLREPLA